MLTSVLYVILKEVLIQEGHNVYQTLALVCSTFRDIVSTNYLKRRAHFQWLDSKTFNSSAIQYLSTVVIFIVSMEICSFDSQFFYTGVATWSKFSAMYRKAFCTMYTIDDGVDDVMRKT